MNTTSTEWNREVPARAPNQLDLLRQVYEEAGLATEAAERAASADLIALYASCWSAD